MAVGPLPAIHLGGTSARDAFDQYLTAAEAVRAALEALPHAAPHMRDYIGRDDDFRAAEAAHGVRRVLLKQVKNELFSLASHASHALDNARKSHVNNNEKD